MNVLHGEPFPTPRGKWSLEFWTFGFRGGGGVGVPLNGCQRWRAGASLALTWSLSPVLLGPGPSPETPSPPSDAHPRPQSSTLGAQTQGKGAGWEGQE